MSIYRILTLVIALFSFANIVFAAPVAGQSIKANPPSSSQHLLTTVPISLQKNKVDINKASFKELLHVSGMTRTKAHNIIAYRKKHGDFKSLEFLKKVKGFTKIKAPQFKLLADQLIVSPQ